MNDDSQKTLVPPYVILAAVSFDETGDFALYEAARIARARSESELHVVHVIPDEGALEASDALPVLDRRLERAPHEIEARLERLWVSEEPCKITAHLRIGAPARSIVQAAIDIDADLLVVGSHRRARLDRLILGSVAERVLREAYCPVLIAHPKNYAGTTRSPSIEPPCPDCVETRRKTAAKTYWCERHSRAYHPPHVYEPSARGRHSVMPAV